MRRNGRDLFNGLIRYCMEAFDPFRWSNVAINIIAVLSCWLSEWIMPNMTKRV